jgi:putative addiction module component (TIGR02574 family)
MITLEEIHAMPVAEKILTMEALWDDLSHADQVEIPDWHKEILDERLAAMEAGTVTFISLDELKKQVSELTR